MDDTVNLTLSNIVAFHDWLRLLYFLYSIRLVEFSRNTQYHLALGNPLVDDR